MYKILIVFVLLFLIIFFNRISLEKFDYNTNCTDCKFKSYHQCRNCLNCGVCIDEFGNMTCTPGNHDGPYTRTDCFKWYYGNIYPQFDNEYYDEKEEIVRYNNGSSDTDARFYPFLKTIDELKNSTYFTDAYHDRVYKRKNTELKNQYHKQLEYRIKQSNIVNDIKNIIAEKNTDRLQEYLNKQDIIQILSFEQINGIVSEHIKELNDEKIKQDMINIVNNIKHKYKIESETF